MKIQRDFLTAYELPRPARLASNLYAACFPLMKLLPARYILERAKADGKLLRCGKVAETTSGTLGLALAMLSATEGFKLTLISATSLMDEPLMSRLRNLGTHIEIIEDPVGSGAQRERLTRLQAILEEQPDTFWPRQYDNPDNRLAYGKLAEWITRAFGQVDCLVGCVGSGGSLCGTGEFLRDLFPDLILIAVDTHHSVLFGHEPGPRLLRGLGNSLLPANLHHDLIDEVHWVGALPAFASTLQLYREHALFMGPTSGAATLVANWYARAHPDAKIVVILPDEGHRYQHTIHDRAWLAQQEGWPVRLPDAPVTLERITERSESEWTRFAWARMPRKTDRRDIDSS
ncbi:PLP-dependent cysteine synthase family protein [Paracoccus onubensis]|uniref:Cysteine synthase family protein n=1 Tax=Paracoccus onubensis TaxID=1675788 RepID=A0A418T1Y9_9RHOB|nr:cysteine synthase family protein [Paracoccus onubensis]RJE87222.1 cysteine synthase family protein [Paracoccus onubensis]